MDPVKASATATGVAVARGAHRSCDQPPWVLDDPFALQLAGPRWAESQSASEAAFPETALRQSRASVVARSRYAEDRLVSGGYRQYVILGAGLDSFAWRRADLIGWLRLFEVDHPASQAWKLDKIAELDLPIRDGAVSTAGNAVRALMARRSVIILVGRFGLSITVECKATHSENAAAVAW